MPNISAYSDIPFVADTIETNTDIVKDSSFKEFNYQEFDSPDKIAVTALKDLLKVSGTQQNPKQEVPSKAKPTEPLPEIREVKPITSRSKNSVKTGLNILQLQAKRLRQSQVISHLP